MSVHNHGPEEGAGLSCNESRLPDGSLKGACMSDERTLSEVIREGMAEAMAAGNKAVWEQFQKETEDAEDHIIRGTD